ncbi:MAG: hypothetical protein EXS05_01335 [Planctomycetaceae bacterium]|nr:hypothetical protein [Planctomycetaceae bacterium]
MLALTTWRFTCGFVLAAMLVGCETPQWALKLDEAFAPSTVKKSDPADARDHRTKYVASRDSASLNWLLAHKIDSGMSLADVCKVLGEQGELEERKNWITNRGGNYQIGDDVYAFGPDNKGRKLYLVFRENMLVNFDPTEFEKSSR